MSEYACGALKTVSCINIDFVGSYGCVLKRSVCVSL